MEERIIELQKAVERIDALEERFEQISLNLNQKEDRKDIHINTCLFKLTLR